MHGLLALTIATALPPQTPTHYARFATTANGIGAADYVRFALERAYPCPIERSPR